jgi:hypothetical protein
MKVPSTYLRHQEVRNAGNGASRGKTTSTFELCGVWIARGWLDGGGKTCLQAKRAALVHQSFRVVLRTPERDVRQKRRPGSFGSITVEPLGRAYSHRRGESVTRSDRRRGELWGSKALAAARPAGVNPRRENTVGPPSKPSPCGLRCRASERSSKLDSYRTPFYD